MYTVLSKTTIANTESGVENIYTARASGNQLPRGYKVVALVTPE